MSRAVGIEVAADAVRAVLLRRGAVAARAELPRAGGVDVLTEEVAAALAELSPGRRAVATAAFGPALSRVRRVRGLPETEDARLLAGVVREGMDAFFLRGPGPLRLAGVRVEGPGEVLAAAVDAAAVAAVRAGCARAGVRLRGTVPAAVAVSRAAEDGAGVVRDGEDALRLEVEGGALRDVRPVPPVLADDAPLRPAAVLAPLGDGAPRWAAAVGAALLPPRDPLLLRPGHEPGDAPRVPRWRLGLAGGALLVTVLAALFVPALVAARAEETAELRLAALRERRAAAVVAAAELERVTGALREAAAWEARAVSPTLLLADLARVLPEPGAVVTLQLDSAGGTLVVLAPRAAGVPAALEGLAGVVGPEIVGPVTRERQGEREMERATIRFRLDPAARRGSDPAADAPEEADL